MDFIKYKEIRIEAMEAELSGLEPKKAINTLFAIRNRLFEFAGKGESFREIVFEHRGRLAQLFSQFGGKPHQETARIFKELSSPDDLEKYIPKKSEAKPSQPEKPRQRPFAFFTLGPDLTEEEYQKIKRFLNSKSIKMGSISPINFQQLLDLQEKSLFARERTFDTRPIFITQPLDEVYCRQIFLLLQSNPSLKGRLKILEWKGDNPEIMSIETNPLFLKMLSTPSQ